MVPTPNKSSPPQWTRDTIQVKTFKLFLKVIISIYSAAAAIIFSCF